MTDIRLVVAGAGGRMGEAVIRNALKTPGIKLVAGIEKSESKKLGQDLGKIAGGEAIGGDSGAVAWLKVRRTRTTDSGMLSRCLEIDRRQRFGEWTSSTAARTVIRSRGQASKGRRAFWSYDSRCDA